VLSLALAAGLSADPFADAVTEFSPGPGAGFGDSFFPDNVLGPPEGGPTVNDPQEFPQHLLSLGNGGSITLAFIDNAITDGPGVDFLTFENVLIEMGSGLPFIEAAIVEVSEDGVAWMQFPTDYVPPAMSGDPVTAESYVGFAGVQPTLSNSMNGIDPTNPAVAGGDGFDLADVGLSVARFVRITDTGVPGTASEHLDGDGDPINDPGNIILGGIAAGFDLDAVAAVNSEPISAVPRAAWNLYR
jgi:hypothetical protein